eukprot:PLAT14691.2.p1 GENE.PLAT14691.2~~PLAT14691.2.p1  ORF type:complete len:197 (-),score=35.66 PLAT14691.2:200-790(-)
MYTWAAMTHAHGHKHKLLRRARVPLAVLCGLLLVLDVVSSALRTTFMQNIVFVATITGVILVLLMLIFGTSFIAAGWRVVRQLQGVTASVSAAKAATGTARHAVRWLLCCSMARSRAHSSRNADAEAHVNDPCLVWRWPACSGRRLCLHHRAAVVLWARQPRAHLVAHVLRRAVHQQLPNCGAGDAKESICYGVHH